MPDTGAPWNIPYVEPADLVRDYPAASEALGTAIAGGLTAVEVAGLGTNVVGVTKLDAFTTTSTSFVDITGFTATITPTSATSKVLIIASLAVTTAGDSRVQLRRDSTDIGISTAGSTRNSSLIPRVQATQEGQTQALVFLDSPAAATATVYKVQVITDGTALTVNANRTGDDGTISTLVLIEVKV
jgi:hypothetical protein